jgi:hypothetical protein
MATARAMCSSAERGACSRLREGWAEDADVVVERGGRNSRGGESFVLRADGEFNDAVDHVHVAIARCFLIAPGADSGIVKPNRHSARSKEVPGDSRPRGKGGEVRGAWRYHRLGFLGAADAGRAGAW